MTPEVLPRLIIICGHYGTGKTELAVNLALALRAAGRRVAVADLDIVNPYFRSREREELFTEHGIHLIKSETRLANADVPALPAELATMFDDPTLCSVADVGGDPVGARVLKRFVPRIQATPHALFFVVNANRPQTGDVDKALCSLRAIENTTGLKFTHLAVNTHLCGFTSIEDVVRGHRLGLELSAKTGIPLAFDAVERRLCDEASARIDGDVFPLDIYMKKPWE